MNRFERVDYQMIGIEELYKTVPVHGNDRNSSGGARGQKLKKFEKNRKFSGARGKTAPYRSDIKIKIIGLQIQIGNWSGYKLT